MEVNGVLMRDPETKNIQLYRVENSGVTNEYLDLGKDESYDHISELNVVLINYEIEDVTDDTEALLVHEILSATLEHDDGKSTAMEAPEEVINKIIRLYQEGELESE